EMGMAESDKAKRSVVQDAPFLAALTPFAAWAFGLHLLGGASSVGRVVAATVFAVGVALWLKPWRDMPVWSHVAPLAAWFALMAGLGEPPAAWKYAVRVALGLLLLVAARPWRGYPAARIRNLPLAFGIGMLVFVIWVFPESPWLAERAPGLYRFYVRYLVGLIPFGQMPEPLTAFPYAPEICGWPMALVRLAGSAVVISIIEEFFYRGFLYRWMLGNKFLEVDPGRRDWTTLLIISLVFASSHNQWFAALLCGWLYGWLYIKTRDIWAPCFAHIVTNFVLGLYVLTTGAYHFW
ncbi:MAG: CAAX prenyl protease-related protein, partial [Kiritimatiellia bacterium]|nr:CAAX prenyl protease-related protein [Kiritimatiellia bacterium]